MVTRRRTLPGNHRRISPDHPASAPVQTPAPARGRHCLMIHGSKNPVAIRNPRSGFAQLIDDPLSERQNSHIVRVRRHLRLFQSGQCGLSALQHFKRRQTALARNRYIVNIHTLYVSHTSKFTALSVCVENAANRIGLLETVCFPQGKDVAWLLSSSFYFQRVAYLERITPRDRVAARSPARTGPAAKCGMNVAFAEILPRVSQ